MKLYYPKSLLDLNPKKRFALFPLLKVFLKKDRFVSNPATEIYGLPDREMKIVASENEADLIVLPMSWDFYLKKGEEDKARGFIESAIKTDKPIAVFISGDFGVKIPNFKNVTVFRYSGYQSKLPVSHIGLPAFIRDPLKRYYETNTVITRSYEAVPTIGFCGQASASIRNTIKEYLRVLVRNTSYFLRQTVLSPQTVESTSYNRFKLLKRLKKSDLLKANFILRRQYGGGIKDGRGKTQIAKDYFANMKNSDYILCYRGAGNFSVRFYETLAMGRIPVYIDTDGFLPLNDHIDWNAHVVWIKPNDIKHMDVKIQEFHQALGEKGFHDLQIANRSIWHDRLNLWQFFYTTFEDMKK